MTDASPIPRMLMPQPLGGDLFCLPAWLPVPDHGVLAANAFVIRGPEPVLVGD